MDGYTYKVQTHRAFHPHIVRFKTWLGKDFGFKLNNKNVNMWHHNFKVNVDKVSNI